MSRPLLVSALSALVLATIGLAVVSVAKNARARTRATQPAHAVAAVPFQAPALGPIAAVRGSSKGPAPRPQPSFGVAEVPPGANVAVRSKPGGRVLARVGPTTQFGSRSTLSVAAVRGRWIAVTSTDLPNGRLGWVDTAHTPLRAHHTRISIRVDLSSRRLTLLDGRRVLRRATVGIGRPGSPTPTGRFAITDKLSGSSYGPYYGCCILALSGHQTNTPAGWQGGNRLAIHGTDDPASIGVPSSAGCLHADAADLRVLMRRVPLGTPVFIRR